jgi:transcriptional regulator of acetoin/glycerol metabolism
MPATKTGNAKLSALLALHDQDGDPRALLWIGKALRVNHGNVDHAAKSLNVTRQTFYAWFKKYPELRRIRDHAAYLAREEAKANP